MHWSRLLPLASQVQGVLTMVCSKQLLLRWEGKMRQQVDMAQP
jgi:hypothetical protein